MSLYSTHQVQQSPPAPPAIAALLAAVTFLAGLAAVAFIVVALLGDQTNRFMLLTTGFTLVGASIGSAVCSTIIELLWKISESLKVQAPKPATASDATLASSSPALSTPAPVNASRAAPLASEVEARKRELERKIAAIEATVTDPTERQRLKVRAIADHG